MNFARTPAALALAVVLLAAASARAEEPADGEAATPEKLVGLRAEAGVVSGFGTTVTGSSAQGAAVRASSFGNVRIGYDFPMGITALLYLGLSTDSVTITPQNNARAARGGSATLFQLGAEGRYYFTRGRTEPFGFLQLSKTFVSLGETTGGDPVQQPQHNLAADIADTFGFAFGAGAEHGVTRQFAIGAKVGLDFTFRSYEDRDTNVQGSATAIGTALDVYLAYRF